MCDLAADVGSICVEHGLGESALDGALAQASMLQGDGLCRLDGRRITIPKAAYRMMRVVAACFDAHLADGAGRHAKAV